MEGIQKGFFNNAKLIEEAEKLDADYKNKKLRDTVQGPWDAYKDSFDDNTEDVCKGLVDAIRTYPDHTPTNYVDGAVMFLKKMGKAKEAQQAIADWIEANEDEPKGFFDVRNNGFAVQDPDLKKAITDKYNSFVDDRNPAGVLFDIAKNHGWHDEDIDLLAKVTADDFYKMFKTLRELNLRAVVKKALELGAQGAAGDVRYVTIATNALAALARLRKESPINEQRVSGLYKVP